MTISANAQWQTFPTTGSDTNGAGFDPSLVSGATGVATDLTDAGSANCNTATPTVNSATYTFVSGDVGAWIFIAAGTNWVKGWYKITAVNAGVATLSAAVGSGRLYSGTTFYNTSAGCASTASPSGGTFAIDYSQQTTANLALTNKSTATTTFTGTGFTPVHIGNAIYTSGTGITTARYFVTVFTNSTTVTVDRSPGTTGTSVTMNLGGAAATLTELYNATRGGVAGNIWWLKNTGTYAYGASGPTMVAGSTGVNSILWGYNSVPGDLDNSTSYANHPKLQNNGTNTSQTLTAAANTVIKNVWSDGGTGGSKGSNCFVNASNLVQYINCKASVFATNGFQISGTTVCSRCQATGGVSGSTGAFNTSSRSIFDSCYANSNVGSGFVVSTTSYVQFDNCIADSNSGASADGFQVTNTGQFVITSSIAYNNGRDGLRIVSSGGADTSVWKNCIFASNAGFGVKSVTTNYPIGSLVPDYNAFYSNTSGNYSQVPQGPNDQSLSGVPFTNAGSGDFSLNNTTGAGASCRATGYPGVFPSGTTTGYLDIGIQHQDKKRPRLVLGI